MNFLPNNYKSPKIYNNYMKLQDGENKFRILSKPILGWEEWNNKTPVRYHFNDKPSTSIDPKKPAKHFWSMIVWNYNEEQIQILHITQATIRNSIEALCEDTDWGAPFFYDIKVMKKGEQKDTEYNVLALPHKKLSEHIKNAFIEKKCNLEALFDNLDPFSSDVRTYTPGIFSEDDIEVSVTMSPFEELKELMVIDGINTQYLNDFINLTAEKKQTIAEEVIKSALRPQLIQKFKTLYLAELPNFVQAV